MTPDVATFGRRGARLAPVKSPLRASAGLVVLTTLGCGGPAPTRLVDLHTPALTASHGMGIAPTGELVASADVELSFPEVGVVLHDGCPTLAVTVSVNSVTLPVTNPGGPTKGCLTAEGTDCSGVCQPFRASGSLAAFDGTFTVAIRDESATFFMSSSNLIQTTRFGLTEPERSSVAEPWSVVLSTSGPVHLFNAMDPNAVRDDPDPKVPRLYLDWNIAREFPEGIQVDPRHVRIPLPPTSGTTVPELTPTLTQERPSIETCDGPATCAGTGSATARPFWFWFDYPTP